MWRKPASPPPQLVGCNLGLKTMAKRGSFDETLALYSKMRANGLLPDSFSYPFVLKAMASLDLPKEGKKAHALAIKTGFELDAYTSSSLMAMYAELGSVDASRKLFDEMPHKSLVLWNVLIGCYIKCHRFAAATAVFGELVGGRVMPDDATLLSTVSACAAGRDLRAGTMIHGYCVNRELGFSLPVANALLDMYVKCSCLDEARRFFDDMPVRNVISWTTVVSGYANAGELDEAKRLFDQCTDKDVILWTAMINGYVQDSRFEEALALFRDMQMEGIEPDKFTVVALLTCCSSLGALQHGEWIHRYIEDTGMNIDAVVGTALIDMYAKCGHVDKSMEVFGRVRGRDTATWTSVICGLAANGRTSRALALFEEMQKDGRAKPDDITFVGVLTACCHGGLVDEGRRHFRAMKDVYRMEPKVEHYSCLVDLLGRAGLLDEAERLTRDMPSGSHEDVTPLWGALLAACKVHGDIEMGERLAQQIAELESQNSSVHLLMSNIFAAASRWEDVTRARRTMKELGLKKTAGFSSIEVKGTRICEQEAGNDTCSED